MQRAVERRGIPTVSPTVARDVTEHAKPPRAVFLPFLMGHLFGVPHHVALQRRIIMECLGRVTDAPESGDIHTLPISWSTARREGIEIERGLGLRG
ncbi:MAG: hypothetical protein H0W63_11365 [Gemmatimonadaceae bacterium]|nr:hypothetical protein [Gemmatimonadaceae bacterium]